MIHVFLGILINLLKQKWPIMLLNEVFCMIQTAETTNFFLENQIICRDYDSNSVIFHAHWTIKIRHGINLSVRWSVWHFSKVLVCLRIVYLMDYIFKFRILFVFISFFCVISISQVAFKLGHAKEHIIYFIRKV